jgi:WD40 repeat protein
VTKLSFDAAGEMLLAERRDGVTVYAVDSTQQAEEVSTPTVIPPHGLITTDNVGGLELLSTFNEGNPSSNVAISPDQRWLLIGGEEREINGDSFVLTQWDFENGRLIRGVGNIEEVEDVSWSPDGEHIAVLGSDAGGEASWPIIHLLDSKSGAEQGYLRGSIFSNWSMSFDPASLTLATGGYVGMGLSTVPGQLALWQVQYVLKAHNLYRTQANFFDYIDDPGLFTVAYKPDDGLLAVSDSEKISLLNESREIVRTFDGDWNFVPQMMFSADGSVLAAIVAARVPHTEYPFEIKRLGVYLWNTDDVEQRTFIPYSTWISTIALSPDGNLFALANDKGIVLLYETFTGRLLKTFRPHNVDNRTWVSDLEFSGDGTLLVSAGYDGVKLWGVKP